LRDRRRLEAHRQRSRPARKRVAACTPIPGRRRRLTAERAEYDCRSAVSALCGSHNVSTLVITGGAGFIGSHLVHFALDPPAGRIGAAETRTSAGSLLNLERALQDPRVTFVRADIADRDAMARVVADHQPAAVLNLAAETHVDRSIDGPRPFIDTNIAGTFVLLETARAYIATLGPDARAAFRFLHVSTHALYGTL